MEVKSLESKVFKDELDFKTFESILESLGHITPKKVSRKEFNEMKGNFLVETGEDKFGKKYDLVLPDDLKVFELPAIILRVNKLTFGEVVPEYASKEELKVKVTITINTLLKVLSERNLNENEEKDIKKAIKKYIKLFEELFGVEESQKLSNESYRNGIIEKSKISQSYERFTEYQKKLEKIKTKEHLDKLLSEVELSMAKEVEEHFEESFFERGINMLRIGMMAITKAEIEAKIRYCEENGYKKSIGKNGDIIYKKGEYTIIIRNISDLDKDEKLLRGKIGIDKLKQELNKVRKAGDTKKISELELKVTNIILKNLYSLPYQLTSENYGYQPKTIKESKEIYCVGFSLLGHAFLSELGIKHNGLSSAEHSMLEVTIGGKSYLFDATLSPNLQIIFEEGIEKPKYGFDDYYYVKYKVEGEKEPTIQYVTKGNAEEILLSQIYKNKGHYNNDNNLRVEFSKKAAKLELKDDLEYGKFLYKAYYDDYGLSIFNEVILYNPNNYEAYFYKGLSLERLKRHDEAINMINIALRINPNDSRIYFEKGKILIYLGKIEEGISFIDNAIKLNPEVSDFFKEKGIALYKLGKYKEAIVCFNKVMELDNYELSTYKYKSLIFEKLGKSKLSKIYMYVYSKLSIFEGNKNIDSGFLEKEKIDKLFEESNKEGLRLYLLELEKQEN